MRNRKWRTAWVLNLDTAEWEDTAFDDLSPGDIFILRNPNDKSMPVNPRGGVVSICRTNAKSTQGYDNLPQMQGNMFVDVIDLKLAAKFMLDYCKEFEGYCNENR